jgi:hypothetical protein
MQIVKRKQMKKARISQSSTIGDGFPNRNQQNGKYTSDAQ